MSNEMNDLEFEIYMALEVASMFKPTQSALVTRIRKTLKKYLANASDELKAEFKERCNANRCNTDSFKGMNLKQIEYAIKRQRILELALAEATKLNLV